MTIKTIQYNINSETREKLDGLSKVFPGLSDQGLIDLAIDFLCNDYLESKEGYKNG